MTETWTEYDAMGRRIERTRTVTLELTDLGQCSTDTELYVGHDWGMLKLALAVSTNEDRLQ